MTPLERVMQTYRLMTTLTAEQEDTARARLQKFLDGKTGTEHELAVQGLQFLRGHVAPQRRTRRRSPVIASPE
jgi:hypothetical protein